MVDLPARLTEPLATNPLVGRNAMAIAASKVELAELALGQVLAALKRSFAGSLSVSILIGSPFARCCK